MTCVIVEQHLVLKDTVNEFVGDKDVVVVAAAVVAGGGRIRHIILNQSAFKDKQLLAQKIPLVCGVKA